MPATPAKPSKRAQLRNQIARVQAAEKKLASIKPVDAAGKQRKKELMKALKQRRNVLQTELKIREHYAKTSNPKKRAALKKKYEALKAQYPKLYSAGPVGTVCIPCMDKAIAKHEKANRAAAAKKVFPGQQKYGNCGLQSVSQLIQQAKGTKLDEKKFLKKALKDGNASKGEKGKPGTWGGTSPQQRQKILKQYGVDSSIQKTSKENLAKAIKEKKGIVANVNVSELWKPTKQSGGHAIVVTDGQFDKDGNLTGVYINDTGKGDQGKLVPVEDFMKAANAHPSKSPKMNVTDKPIWP